jgi:selenocysteine lyase/cysteine desulfurase
VALAAELRNGLVQGRFRVLTPEGNRSSIVAFANPKGLDTTRALFDRSNIQISLRQKGTQIRVSAALFNNRTDFERFLSAVEPLARESSTRPDSAALRRR